MAASIRIDQAAKPAGVAGQARQDIDTGVLVTATAVGGPFLAHQWSILHAPVAMVPTQLKSAAALSAPTAAATNISPIDLPGTYLIQLAVDSGSGLGALPGDNARITFGASEPIGTGRGPFAANIDEFPRRVMAFREQLEHNAPDALDAGGNPDGWDREWRRWFATIERISMGRAWAWALVDVVAGVSAAVEIVNGKPQSMNVATAVRTGLGVYPITFTRAMPEASYIVSGTVFRGSASGFCRATAITAVGFTMNTFTIADAPADRDFEFAVRFNNYKFAL
jgi:hypothetical protein